MINDFVSDLEFPNQEYGYIVRSNEAGSKIIGIETDGLPEGSAFFTAKDIKGKNYIELFGKTIPVFAESEIEYAGQAVGILTNSDKEILKEAAKLILIKTEKKPESVAEYENGKKDFFDYPVIAKKSKSGGNCSKIFETEDKIIYSTLKTAARYRYLPEPASVKVCWKDSSLDIYAPVEWASHTVNAVSNALAIDANRISVIRCSQSGGMSGSLWFSSLLAVQAAAAAHILQKNVTLEFSREEDFLYTPKTPQILIQHKSAVSGGMIKACDISIMIDAGAYNPLIEEIVKHTVITALGIYAVPNYNIEAMAVKTKGMPTDIFSDLGDEYVTAALEKHINEMILELDICPVQFRMDNILHTGKYLITGNAKKQNYGFENLFKAACSTSDFFRKYYAHQLLNSSRYVRSDGSWRGIGIAAGLQYNGSYSLIKAGFKYTAAITLTIDSKIYVKAEPSSENLKRILKKQITKKLEIENPQIIFEESLNLPPENSPPSISSFGISILMGLVDECCTEIQNKRFREPLPIEVSKTYCMAEGTDWEPETLTGTPFISETPAVCVVELELNPSLYEVYTRGIWFVCCPGETPAKKKVLRDLNRTITNALSSICCESIPEGAECGIMPYKLLSAESVPAIKIFTVDSGPQYPLGINEIAAGLVPAAYLSALNQIMIKQPQKIEALPITVKNIFDAFTTAEEDVV